MKSKLSRVHNFFSVVSKDSHLWGLGVILGAVLLSVCFFLEPLNRDFFAESRTVKAAEQEVADPEVYNISTKLSEGSDEKSNINVTHKIEVVKVSEDNDTAVTMDEYDALCKIVTAEANTEDIIGQILIANVVMNRVKSDKFPNSIEEVILSPGQFDPVTSGSYYSLECTDTAKEAVMRALSGEDYSEGALYFQKSAATIWGNYQYLFRHGNHSFYK